jgi:hypothetical protein
MRLSAATLVLIAALLFPSLAQARDIYITNTSELPQAQLVDELSAFQDAIDQDFASAWQAPATLKLGEAPPGEAQVEIVDQPNCWFCAGYHDVQNGAPHAVVGDIGNWQITLSHELFELLADPYINRGVLVQKNAWTQPKWYALEVCDPVENDKLAYIRPSATGRPVWISDFVTEAWFIRGSKGPYDFRHKVKRPLQVLSKGYQLVWDGWQWGQ